MSAPFDLNEDSQMEDDSFDINWSQVSQVLSSQDAFCLSSVPMPTPSPMPTPTFPPSFSRAFTHVHALPPPSSFPRPMMSSFSRPRCVMRHMTQTPPFLPSHPIQEFNLPFTHGSPMSSSPNLHHLHRPNHSPTVVPFPPAPHPTSLPSVANSEEVFEDTEVHAIGQTDHPPIDATEDDGYAANTATLEPSKDPPQRKRSAGAKDKINDVCVEASRKQAKTKGRRKQLADGETTNYRDQWSIEDVRVLADAKLRLDKEMAEARGKNTFLSLHERWRRVAAWCKEENVHKTSLQCGDKWENCFPKFKKIRDWDRAIPSGKNSYALMTVEERLEGGFPKHFDKDVYDILETRFAVDILVNPGPILLDSSAETLEKLNSSAGGGPASSGAAENSPTQNAGVGTSGDPSSTGKRRGRAEARTTSVRKEFQDANKEFADRMDRTTREGMEQQQRQADLEQKQLDEFLALQNRQLHVAEAQLQLVGNSMDKLTNLLGAYLANQGPRPT